MPLDPLPNFEIQKYYRNEPKFNDVYSRNNLPKIRNGTNVINLDAYNRNILDSFTCKMQHALMVLELSIFHKKLKNS